MQRTLLTVVSATCAAADLPAGSPISLVKSEAETSTHTTAKFGRCSSWSHGCAPSQSKGTTQRYRATGQAFRWKVSCSVSSVTMQPHLSWGSFKHISWLLCSGVEQLTWSRSTKDCQYTRFLRNESPAKQATKRCCSWTSGQLQDTTLQCRPLRPQKHIGGATARAWGTMCCFLTDRRRPQKTPCHRQQRIHGAATAAFLAQRARYYGW